jgi:hypothetical protein
MGIANSSGIIYLVGGRNQKDPINRINGYFIPSGEWKELQIPMDKGWSQFGVIGLGTNIYAIGGKNNELPTGKNLTYQVVYITVLPIVK